MELKYFSNDFLRYIRYVIELDGYYGTLKCIL
jgi:hypothetical protein